MKITRRQLRKIIKEELTEARGDFADRYGPGPTAHMSPERRRGAQERIDLHGEIQKTYRKDVSRPDIVDRDLEDMEKNYYKKLDNDYYNEPYEHEPGNEPDKLYAVVQLFGRGDKGEITVYKDLDVEVEGGSETLAEPHGLHADGGHRRPIGSSNKDGDPHPDDFYGPDDELSAANLRVIAKVLSDNDLDPKYDLYFIG
ncbi:hypothetical protein CMI47_21895 [Candidatus Pacearchaeota archaeon]|nr:hypothetical protein [Candidatus Pacearchaeota archaeon]|tara:strand:+ start:175 stop:771 length:597 start_codon:yes stop_codon:yes gene_type:complete